MNFATPEGATPLNPNEIGGLRLSYITTRAELDRWEQDNIAEAEVWACLVHLLKQPRFTWGSGNLFNAGECRKEYIDALRAADRYDYEP